MTHSSTKRIVAGTAVIAALLVGACADNRKSSNPPADVQVRGTDPNIGAKRTGNNTLNNDVIAAPDADGIVTYDGYQSAIARDGDTVTTIAGRVGLSASELGAYNGLPADHRLRSGDELVLPPRPGGYGPNGPQARVIDPASDRVVAAPVSAPTAPTNPSLVQQPLEDGTQLAAAAGVAASPLPPTPGGTVISDVAPAAAPAPAASTGWSPDLAAAAIDRSTGIQDDGTLGAPPSATQPTPPEPTARADLQSPDLSQYQTEASAGAPAARPAQQVARAPSPEEQQPQQAAPARGDSSLRLRRPVSGPIAVGFNKGSGPSRNDGVDFAAAAGSPVVAAADGEVALVSKSLGGLGTIVLVRHPNEILTVYGRIDNVSVNKGDLVRAGQQIGEVSNAGAPAEPRMHFEVRRGAESLDPTQFL